MFACRAGNRRAEPTWCLSSQPLCLGLDWFAVIITPWTKLLFKRIAFSLACPFNQAHSEHFWNTLSPTKRCHLKHFKKALLWRSGLPLSPPTVPGMNKMPLKGGFVPQSWITPWGVPLLPQPGEVMNSSSLYVRCLAVGGMNLGSFRMMERSVPSLLAWGQALDSFSEK